MTARRAITITVLALFAGACGRKPPGGAPPPAREVSAELASSQERGRALYAEMCAVCHGARAEGYAADRAPRLAHPNFLAAASDDFIARAIADGRSGTTMSAWARERGGPLSAPQIEDVVAFVRGFETAPRAELDERPVSGEAARGELVYEQQCRACHGERGVGGPELQIGGQSFLQSASDGFLRHAVKTGRPPTPMLAYEAKLSPEQIEDVVTLIRSWQALAVEPSRATPQAPLPLGPVPLNPDGPEPDGFQAYPGHTKVDVVKAALDRKARLVILDSRVPSDYLREHIAGAVSVPFYAPEPYVADLPRDAWLVCYCACPHAESRALAQKLVASGFQRVTVLDEGLGVWKARGYPLASGAPASPRD